MGCPQANNTSGKLANSSLCVNCRLLRPLLAPTLVATWLAQGASSHLPALPAWRVVRVA